MKIHAPGLAGWLAIATAVLVTLAVAVVSIVGIRLLQDLAEADGRTRVALAVSDARESLRQSTEDLLTATQVLGERPTLRRLLRGDGTDGLDPYLSRYCEGAALHGCAVVRNGTPIAAIALEGLEADWEQILAAGAEQGERFMVTGAAAGVALAGAQSPVLDGEDGLAVYAVRKLDAEYAERLGERTGFEIRIVDYASFNAGEGEFSVLNSDALAGGEPVSAYLVGLDAYAASLPIAASTGETIGLLQAILPASAVMGPVEKMNRRMLRVAIIVALLATISGILIGRHWIGGVQRLTMAARRLGSGDLAASIPPAGGKELSILASTMEDMRRNLVDLTGELRKREAEAQAVLGGIVEGVYAVDAERRIRFMNPQAERLLNTSSADAIGQFCGDLLKPARDAQGLRPCEHACPIVKARQAGSAEAVEQIKPHRRQHRVVIASSAPGDGMQVQVLRDETELEAVRRTRDTVLANISHEFRTPLAAQLASIELLRDGLGEMSPAAQQQLVFSLERGAQRLTWLIDNLLESVRIESGQLGIRHQDVDLAEVVRAARELIEPLLDQRGQVLDVRIPGGLPVLWGDEQRLIQVVVNLLANASKFGPPNSTIRIGAKSSANGGVEFWVDDAGPGPPDTDDDALFEQFRRSGGEDPEESGLGLGLYIVRSIVERHGGEVSLGRGPESGTRARVELPAESHS
ncbi:MAG TPA: ATP-binding protein [Woeseiaceae bacterium]|nr:ATP-binding protein [Woeseiaceae bacterium]